MRKVVGAKLFSHKTTLWVKSTRFEIKNWHTIHALIWGKNRVCRIMTIIKGSVLHVDCLKAGQH